jgi:hypothetical protein
MRIGVRIWDTTWAAWALSTNYEMNICLEYRSSYEMHIWGRVPRCMRTSYLDAYTSRVAPLIGGRVNICFEVVSFFHRRSFKRKIVFITERARALKQFTWCCLYLGTCIKTIYMQAQDPCFVYLKICFIFSIFWRRDGTQKIKKDRAIVWQRLSGFLKLVNSKLRKCVKRGVLEEEF